MRGMLNDGTPEKGELDQPKIIDLSCTHLLGKVSHADHLQLRCLGLPKVEVKTSENGGVARIKDDGRQIDLPTAKRGRAFSQ